MVIIFLREIKTCKSPMRDTSYNLMHFCPLRPSSEVEQLEVQIVTNYNRFTKKKTILDQKSNAVEKK